LWIISLLLMLTAALWLSPVSAAQANSSAPSSSASSSSQSAPAASTSAAQQPPSSPAETAPGEIPTAAQVTAAGGHDAAAAPDAKPATSTSPAGAAAKPAQANASTLPSKYNVDLIGQRDVGSGIDFYSLDREMALGRQLSQEVESSCRLVTDPVIDEYINRIGQNLVRHSDARVPFTIKVLDNQEVNAFALPGGFFYVDSGLILAADNEAELAGVMAHEIAHVAARHATKNMTRAQIWNMAAVPLIFIGGPIAYAVSEVAGLAVPLSFLKFSRDAEREADLLGLEYDYATGYDPQAFVQFFEKLNVEKKKPNFLAKAFATHPMNVERIEAAQDEIRKYLPDRPEYIVDTSEFENIKARLWSLENGRRIGGAKEDPGRPVLLKRASTSDSGSGSSGSSSTSNDSGSQPQDNSRPTLKRNPSSGSDTASAGSAPDTSGSSNDDDSGRPTLKRNPSGTDDSQYY
jgi:beta-barrel assembly-enhancing protease